MNITTVEGKRFITDNKIKMPLVSLEYAIFQSDSHQAHDAEHFLTYIVINHKNAWCAFIVDDVQEEREILIKKIEKPFSKLKYITGVTLLNDGAPVPVISPIDLMDQITSLSTHAASIQGNTEIKSKQTNNKPRLLVVDDSITTRTLIQNILEMAGYETMTASNGLEAWQLIKQHPFSALVSDVDMPRMNGFELTEKIKKDEKYAQLPVILVTGKETAADKERGLDVGASAYIVKSKFDDSDLLQIIKNLI